MPSSWKMRIYPYCTFNNGISDPLSALKNYIRTYFCQKEMQHKLSKIKILEWNWDKKPKTIKFRKNPTFWTSQETIVDCLFYSPITQFMCKRRLRDWGFFCKVNNQRFFQKRLLLTVSNLSSFWLSQTGDKMSKNGTT